MVTEFLNGMMEEDMKAIGITVNNMEKVYTLMWIMLDEQVSGKKEKELNGLMM